MGAQSPGLDSAHPPQATQLGLHRGLVSQKHLASGGLAANLRLWALFRETGPQPCLPFPKRRGRPWASRVPITLLSSPTVCPGQGRRTSGLWLSSKARSVCPAGARPPLSRAKRKKGQVARLQCVRPPGRQCGASGVGALRCSLVAGVQLSVGLQHWTGRAGHVREQPLLDPPRGFAHYPDRSRAPVSAPATPRGIPGSVCFRSFPQERIEEVSTSPPPTLSLHSCSRGFCKATGPLSTERGAHEK